MKAFATALHVSADDASVAEPAATLRLLSGDSIDLEPLLAALADDALAMIPAAARVSIHAAYRGEVAASERGAAPLGPSSVAESLPESLHQTARLETGIRADEGFAGSVQLWSHPGISFRAADQMALRWLATLATAYLNRSSIRDSQRAQQTAERRFEATFVNAPIGIAHVAPDGRFLLVNDQFCAITGRSRDELIAHGFANITHPDDIASDLAHVNRLLSGKAERYMMEKRYIRPDGETVLVNLTVALVRDASGEPDFFVSVIEDLSEIKRAHAEASRDPLTGLLNRRGLMERAQHELDQAPAERPIGIIYLDLDRFKRINDALGHAVGDACLVAVARALTATLRQNDGIARVGGDEFVMVLPDVAQEQGAEIIAKLRNAVAAADCGLPWSLSGSFGWASTIGGRLSSAAELIQEADAAMFEAKRAGKLTG